MRPASADGRPDLAPFADLVPRDHGLAVVALARPDGTVHRVMAAERRTAILVMPEHVYRNR
jgi:hypothetical protein